MREVLYAPWQAPAMPALVGWLVGLAQPEMNLLLAHCDDAVVWGRVDWGAQGAPVLRQAAEFFVREGAAALRTLEDAGAVQAVRLFGAAGEIFAWRGEGGFAARLVWQEGALPPGLAEALAGRTPAVLDDALPDEKYLLWGTEVEMAAPEGFVLLREGRQGLRHAPPLPGLGRGERAALRVRHYLGYDEDGHAGIKLSRLAGLTAGSVGKGGER